MDTHIPANNVGYKLLLKMGWKAGTGLGQNASGTSSSQYGYVIDMPRSNLRPSLSYLSKICRKNGTYPN